MSCPLANITPPPCPSSNERYSPITSPITPERFPFENLEREDPEPQNNAEATASPPESSPAQPRPRPPPFPDTEEPYDEMDREVAEIMGEEIPEMPNHLSPTEATPIAENPGPKRKQPEANFNESRNQNKRNKWGACAYVPWKKNMIRALSPEFAPSEEEFRSNVWIMSTPIPQPNPEHQIRRSELIKMLLRNLQDFV